MEFQDYPVIGVIELIGLIISRSLSQLNEVAMTFLKVAQSCLHFYWNFPKQKLYFISNPLVPLKNVKKAIAALSEIQTSSVQFPAKM